jgi:hypothetical protein
VTRRHLHLLGALLLALGAALAAGCSDDSTDNCESTLVIQIRDGSWEITEEIRYVAADTSCFGPEITLDSTYVEQDTLVYCEYVATGDDEASDLCCQNTVTGNDIDVACSVTYPLDVCQLVFEVTANGTVTDTTFDVTLRFLDTISGPENPCVFFDGYRDTCLTDIHTTGRWLSADGADTTCVSTARTGDDMLRLLVSRAKTRLTR